MSEASSSEDGLQKIEAAIQAQETLRGILPDEQIETIITALHARRQIYLAHLEGSGGLAEGDGAKAVGAGGMLIEDSVEGDVYGPYSKVEKHYHGPESTDPIALRATYLNRVIATTSHLSLAGIDPKAASEAETRLSLSAVFSALLTVTPDAHDRVESVSTRVY